MPPCLHRRGLRAIGPRRDLWHPQEHHLRQRRERGWTCTVDDNPVGFCLIVAMKGALVGCAIAEILHAFGLAGDPVAQIQQALPFLASGRVQR